MTTMKRLLVVVVLVVLASSGGAIATQRYLLTSIHQIKPSVIAQLRGSVPNAVQGAQGPTGPPGPAGAEGPPGLANYSIQTEWATGNPGAIGFVQLQVPCPPNTVPLSGGFDLNYLPGLTNVTVVNSYPFDNDSWYFRYYLAPPVPNVWPGPSFWVTCASINR